jgi:hypothetical protein
LSWEGCGGRRFLMTWKHPRTLAPQKSKRVTEHTHRVPPCHSVKQLPFGPLLALGVGAGEITLSLIRTSCRARRLKVVVDRLMSLIDGLIRPGESVDLLLRDWGYGEARESVRDRIRRSSASNE